MLIDKIIEVAADIVRNEPKWISCNERLPENKDGWTELIMSMKNGKVMFGFWTDAEGFCRPFLDGVCRVDGVVAWMPLPEPYREDGEQNG